jgi:Holliday junction DNA helicase RuvB
MWEIRTFLMSVVFGVLYFILSIKLGILGMPDGAIPLLCIVIVLSAYGSGYIVNGFLYSVSNEQIKTVMTEVLDEYQDEGEYEEGDNVDEYVPEKAEPIPDHPALAHILLFGGAGQGKTALANVTKNELERAYGHEVDFIEVTPSQLRRKKELDEVMLRVASNPFCILFIDEVHGLPLVIEESLYKAMQDFEYDITLTKEIALGDGYDIVLNEETGAQTIKLPKYTMIGATTLMGEINKPFKDRFPIRVEMSDYDEEQLVDIIDVFMGQNAPDSFDTYIGQVNAVDVIGIHIKSAMNENLSMSIAEDAKRAIAELSLKTARLVKQRTKNCIAYAKYLGEEIVTVSMVEKAMELFGVDKNGLDRVHRDIIKYLIKRKNKPVGSQALAEAVNVTKSDIDTVYVPELTKIGIITRDGRGMKQMTEEYYENVNRGSL